MTRQEVSCPIGRCPGVLRYDLGRRVNGYVAQCEAEEAWSPRDECGAEYQWDAVDEEWRPLSAKNRRVTGQSGHR